MKFLSLILKSTIRNRRRFILTVLSVASSFFLISTLRTLQLTIESPTLTPESALRLLVRHRVSLRETMPAYYRDKIAAVPGVERVIAGRIFDGSYRDPGFSFPQFAIEPFFDVYPDLSVTPEHQAAFLAEPRAALVGTGLVQRYGWKIGDHVTLTSVSSGLEVETTIRGFISGLGTQANFYFRWDYMNAISQRPDRATLFTIKARSAEDIPSIMENVDTLFENTAAATRTETEKASFVGFLGILGNVRSLMVSIMSVVLFTTVLVMANTMGMSIRERTLEIGIMKTLGFTPQRIVVMVMCESLLLSLVGAALGSLGARFLFASIDVSAITGFPIPEFEVRPETIGIALGISVLVAALSTLAPAWTYARLPITDSIRRRGD